MATFNNDAMLMAAAQMLQASGPSRQPQGLGAILGGGMSTYLGAAEQARQRKMEEDQAKQIAELRALQMRDLEGTLGDKASARANAQRLSALKAGFNPQGQQAPAEIALGSVPMNSSMGQPQPQSAPPNEYQRRMAYANYLRSNGAQDEGDAAAKEALDFMPKVKEWSKVRDGDKVKYAPLFDNGTMGEPVDREIAEKLEFRDAGGSVVGLDAYTGKTASTIRKTQTPDSIASIASAAASRAQADRHFNINQAREARPQFSAEMGGFIAPPSKANPNGALIPLAGAASKGPKMTEDQAKATGWLVQAETAWNNMKAAAYDDKGKLTDSVKPGFPDFVAGIPSFGIGEAAAQTMRGKDRQKFMQAASSAGEALLRAATGAGVNREEAIQKQRELTPQFGDSDEVIAQKMAAMPVYLETLKVRAGPGAKLAADVIPKPAGTSGWGIKKVN